MGAFPINDFVLFEFIRGILCIRFKKGRILNPTAAKGIVRDRIKWQKGFPYPILCDIREILNADMPTRDYFIDHGSHLIKALAFLVSNELDLSMFKYYVQSLQSNTPIQAFYNKEEAMAFLEEYSSMGPQPGPETGNNNGT